MGPIILKDFSLKAILGLKAGSNHLFGRLFLAADPYRRKSIRHHARRKEAQAGERYCP